MSTHTYTTNGVSYDIAKLIKYTDNLRAHEVDMRYLIHNLHNKSWSDENKTYKDGETVDLFSPIDALLDSINPRSTRHRQRIAEAEMHYPIIIDSYENVIDGLHRLTKAFLLNHNTIRCFVLDKLPEECIYVEQ